MGEEAAAAGVGLTRALLPAVVVEVLAAGAGPRRRVVRPGGPRHLQVLRLRLRLRHRRRRQGPVGTVRACGWRGPGNSFRDFEESRCG